MKKIIFSALVVATALGCSKGDNGAQIAGGETSQIKIGVALPDIAVSPSSRVAYDGDVPIKGLKFIRVDATEMPTGRWPDKATRVLGDRTDNGTNIVFATEQYYNGVVNNAYFMAFDSKAKEYSTYAMDWSLDAKTDVLYTDFYDAGTVSSPIVPVMQFKHALAQIEVVCKAEAGKLDEVKARWGKIEYIKFKDALSYLMYSSQSWFILDDTPEGSPPNFSDLPFVQSDYDTDFQAIDIPANDNTTVTAAGMFAPLIVPTFTLLVKTENQPEKVVLVDLGAGNVLKAGEKHVITFTFNAREIVVTTTIEDWSEGAPALNYVF